MSRSNPTENAPHPCARWIDWDGSNGGFKYYDKETKQTVPVPDGFTFILLDQLATIKGWHDASESGIYSNEVKDIRQDVLVVKAFKGGTLAEGVYKDIRDKIIAHGGHFTANLYSAVKIDEELKIASVQFKGAALSAWMEFAKQHRADLYKKAIKCKGFNEGKKGTIVYKTPIFHLIDVSPETDAKALDCDRVLQEFLTGYFSRTRTEQVAAAAPVQAEARQDAPAKTGNGGGKFFDDMDDDIPF